MEKIKIKKLEVAKLTFSFQTTELEGYAMAWLKLTNLCREYNMILKIENDRSNNVYVYCLPENMERIKNGCTDLYTYQTRVGKWESVGTFLDYEKLVVGIPVYEGTEVEEWLPVMWDVDFDDLTE